MDFFKIKERVKDEKRGIIEIYPDFVYKPSSDLMVRGKNFHAIWDDREGLWCTNEFAVQRLVDSEIEAYVSERYPDRSLLAIRWMANNSSASWRSYRTYVNNLPDNYTVLDCELSFQNTPVQKEHYASKKLPYALEEGDISSYDELISTLYDPDERAKIEWCIGAIVSGDSKKIQKFAVFYGAPGTGKSTILNIVEKLFTGYTSTFEAKELASSSNAFATEMFKTNPLVAIQHEGDLSRIEDNAKLNSIVSHEEMVINEKNKSLYSTRINAFLMMGTNKPVRITDAKSGIIRRLIDINPTGHKLAPDKYWTLMSKINFEIGAIAHHCLQVYRSMGPNYYNDYIPVNMMLQTDIFFNFMEENYFTFKEQDGTTLGQAYALYKQFCDDGLVEYKLSRHKFREELKNYFREYTERTSKDRHVYAVFKHEKFRSIFDRQENEEEKPPSIVLDQTTSILDEIYADCPAQTATDRGTPAKPWAKVDTKLSDIDTKETHYVRLPESHIVIDFDLTDETGEKSAELNIAEASKWPATYTEFSRSGKGVHLHYIYNGDTSRISPIFAPGIEIKLFRGNASLRRRLTVCNDLPIATLTGGLPVKEKKVLDANQIKSERSLRDLIERNLRKEIHPGTKPSVDFIHKILQDAYDSGLKYDVTDMRARIIAFANGSTNQAIYCLKLTNDMKFKSDDQNEEPLVPNDSDIVYFDTECFPNLFVISWQSESSDRAATMINPSAKEIDSFIRLKLVGFNNRQYDNHMLYGALLGYDNERLYKLSQDLINNKISARFGEAYNLSYADMYDISNEKKSLKKFEIDLGIHHQELGLPWDQPVPEELWPKVAEYCENDVRALKAVKEARSEDFAAREILSELSGLSVNCTNKQHAAKIIFGDDRKPQDKFVYTDLSEMFPGYEFKYGQSSYRGVNPGEGGLVYAEPGIHYDVALLDVASMHPTSIEQLNLFGPYTKNFSEIKEARLSIKHRDFERAGSMLGGVLKRHLNEEKADALSYALKIIINSVYGLTSAKFDNPFRDPRNVDNIVAKRGALFMLDLKHEVESRGFTVAHIKTDSIKIPGATPEIIQFVTEFGAKYGYTFEHEDTYEKMCLVNDAVYIAKNKDGKWSATGAQFAVPYVFKKLFSDESIEFDDLTTTRSVKSAIYINTGDADTPPEKYRFVGKVGLFCPMVEGKGGDLLREQDGKYNAVTDSKGYKWEEAEVVREANLENFIDESYFHEKVEEAIATIAKFGDPVEFLK